MGCSSSVSASAGKHRLRWAGKHFQILNGSEWEDYSQEEGIWITQAFLLGLPVVAFTYKGTQYQCNFKKMLQVNQETGDVRQIRPHPELRRPLKPVLPEGPVIVQRVRKGDAGKTIFVVDPHNEGKLIPVAVPAKAKAGSRIAVPAPAKGETVEEVVMRQAKFMSSNTSVADAGGHMVVHGVLLDRLLTSDGDELAHHSKKTCTEQDKAHRDDVHGMPDSSLCSTTCSTTGEDVSTADDLDDDDGERLSSINRGPDGSLYVHKEFRKKHEFAEFA